MKATVFAPGSIGNVGPGFDVLGLAVDGIGDRVTVELTEGPARVAEVTGRDGDLVPRDPGRNVASIAAAAWLRNAGIDRQAVVSIEKGLPLAGGLGGSAASSVAGALAASIAAGSDTDLAAVMRAALEGEASVAGRHLDNIAASTVGGLALCRSVEPVDVVAVPVAATWWVVLLTPRVRIETKHARAILPQSWERQHWVQQMANTAGLLYAFATGDASLLQRSLEDLYAEPLRAPLIPNFAPVKQAALDAGALGCSISGGGPTIFAITAGEDHRCAAAMKAAMGDVEADLHIAPIAKRGAHAV
ncbi:MAG TPA: homoserine kinase [Thermoanaerobaculia bacterium]|nr:homoserine kinase [Thermoanaerobaculia bacterium]